MSMNINGNVGSGMLQIQKNSKLYAIGKSMEGKKLDETKKLTGGVIVPQTKASVSFAAEKVRDFLLPDYEIIHNPNENEESTYILDGVEFSGTKIEEVKRVVKSAISDVPRGTLDYKDYAKMGMAENVVRSYGKEQLTKEQAEVVNRAVSHYFDRLIEHEPKATETIDGLYYGKRDNSETIQKIKKYIRDMVANDESLPAHVKQQILSNMGTGKKAGVMMSASNAELANSIRSSFASRNFENEDELQTFFKQYQDWMKPAYQEIHGGNEKFAVEHLARDLVFYKSHYKSLMDSVLAASVGHLDMQI